MFTRLFLFSLLVSSAFAQTRNQPVERTESFQWNEKASALWNRLTEWFLALSERPMGTGWALAIAIGLSLLIILVIYLGGWEHVAVGP